MPVTSAAGTALVVAKTHLDLGFTDLAARVLERYLDELVPAALVTARHLREVDATGTGPRLRWTVGSWLLTEALERGDAARRAELEAAIEAGDLAWHAWPFTTHTGLLDPSLAEWATTLSARLDRRFGVTTVAAKMTDVPGHPRALVPILAGAEEAAGQDQHIIFSVQPAREFGVVDRRAQPEVETAFGHARLERGREARHVAVRGRVLLEALAGRPARGRVAV